ncbi:MAG: oligopeptide/dipeptide ABC transporter ATP-binding protein [Planctomycetota bacterium]|jgi:oligopeptide/dipeptide ABC transporter ATP-binding protein
MSFVEIRNLKLSFSSDAGQIEVLRGVDLTMTSGQILGLVGESGSGKSLTGLAMIGLTDDRARIAADQLEILGCDMLHASESMKRQMRGSDIAMVFQNPTTSLDPHYRIGAQIEEVLRVKGGETKANARKRVRELLAEVGLQEVDRVASSFPHELSGGMNQRVMIALATALQPRLIIADEPTTALDVTTQSRIMELFRDLAVRHQMALLFISHDLGVIKNLCDSVAVLYAGRVVESGPVDVVLSRPKHPYTAALLHSRPKLGGEKRLPEGIPGLPPKPGERISGCAFAARCKHVVDDCLTKQPQFVEHLKSALACHLNDGEGLQ